MADEKVAEKDFNLHFWYATIPMTDDMWLGLQAQNLARVEMSVIRLWEKQVLDEQHEGPGSYQGPKYRELMGLSQMWVFAVYEFMRTWRERARFLIQHEDNYKKLATQEERDEYLKKIVERAKDKERLATRFPAHYAEHVAKIVDPEFMKSVRAYYGKTKELFNELSAVRMPAAKHELPQKPGEKKLVADAPGMGLPDAHTGTMCWRVLLEEKETTIRRRDLADKFFGILSWHEDIETAVGLALEHKGRRKRSRRRRGRRGGRDKKQAESDASDRSWPDQQVERDIPPYFVREPSVRSAEKKPPPSVRRRYPKT